MIWVEIISSSGSFDSLIEVSDKGSDPYNSRFQISEVDWEKITYARRVEREAFELERSLIKEHRQEVRLEKLRQKMVDAHMGRMR